MTASIGKDEKPPFTIEQFYKYLEQKKLMAARCDRCGSMFLPPRPLCTDCFSKELSWVQLQTRGKLVTYTVIHVAPEQFQSMAPYAYGIIELENGVRLPGLIRGLEHEKLTVGIDLQVDFDEGVSPSWPHWTRYFFRPP